MKNKKRLITIIVFASILLVLSVYCAVAIKPRTIKVREETIVSNKVNKTLDGFLLVYFEDLNYGNNKIDLEKVKEIINSFNPDVIIFGGDLLGNKCNGTSEVTSFLKALDAKKAKYAVLGEEDVGKEEIRNIYYESDFRLLSNANEKLFIDGSFVNIVGIDPLLKGSPDISKAYEGVNPASFTFVASHCPDIADKLDISKTDYILSGHSLGGQVYVPLFNLFYRPSGAQNYFKGKHLINSVTLDISSGLGTKEKDIRLFTDAEIVVYKLKAK